MLLPIAEFAYNNTKNANTDNILCKLNYGYHLCVSYNENIDPYFLLKLVKKLLSKLQKLMLICYENLHHA